MMYLLSKTGDDRAIEQREADRRQHSLKTLYGSLMHYRRRHRRREEDGVNTYVDWYGPVPLVTTLSIILLCSLDAFLTSILLSNGAVELNIFMDWLIQRDMYLFAATKMAITAVALVILVMHYNFIVYKSIRVRHLMIGMVPMYALLIAHEINLLSVVI